MIIKDLLFKTYRPIIINMYQNLVDMIEVEEDTLKEIRTLETACYKPEIKQALEVEFILFRTMRKQLNKRLKLDEELKKIVMEYLELKGWLKFTTNAEERL